jgi:hypothetical protein
VCYIQHFLFVILYQYIPNIGESLCFYTKVKSCSYSEYERSLSMRASLTLWISPLVIKSWKPRITERRGRQQRFSDRVIETVLSLRLIFHLPQRQTEGFISSIFQLMKLKLQVPDHTTLSRRGKTIKPKINCHLSLQSLSFCKTSQNADVVVEYTVRYHKD